MDFRKIRQNFYRRIELCVQQNDLCGVKYCRVEYRRFYISCYENHSLKFGPEWPEHPIHNASIRNPKFVRLDAEFIHLKSINVERMNVQSSCNRTYSGRPLYVRCRFYLREKDSSTTTTAMCGRMKICMLRVGNYQKRFNVNVWAGIVGDCLLGPYILPNYLRGNNYLTFLQDIPLGLLKSLHWLDQPPILPSLAGSGTDLAFIGWISHRSCHGWLDHLRIWESNLCLDLLPSWAKHLIMKSSITSKWLT
ncbi:hypothetical protein EAG_14838 [Camponotus floridanus]|uniref:Uncharacterized protein n=1 Tax=Camponotus floridanus TaxID=104421 RepID=E2ABS1_CAMFO|nr:hypothetical protein EAG_14838 [Camponotus floridanus]